MIIIGHRGAGGLAPENTLQALDKGIAYGAHELEVDIRVTSDNIPVLHHDMSLHIGGQLIRIASHSLGELRQYKADLPTLSEALDYVGDRAIMHIEVKMGEPVEPVIQVISGHLSNQTNPKILLGSKSQNTLRQLHAALPDVPKVVIEPWSGVRASLRARELDTKRLSMNHWWLWKPFLRSMQRRGYQIAPYTMNDPRRMRKWQPYLYGIITDYPDRYTESS